MHSPVELGHPKYGPHLTLAQAILQTRSSPWMESFPPARNVIPMQQCSAIMPSHELDPFDWYRHPQKSKRNRGPCNLSSADTPWVLVAAWHDVVRRTSVTPYNSSTQCELCARGPIPDIANYLQQSPFWFS
jgi:hypothetical protein